MNRWDYSASMKFAKEEGVAIGEEKVLALWKKGVPLEEAKRMLEIGKEKD